MEESDSGFFILEISTLTVGTRAGHKLSGRLRCFNDVALYLEIQEEIVTVYAHGIYTLDTRKLILYERELKAREK